MMNFVHTFLLENWEKLELDHYGLSKNLSSLILTPRFSASRHVVFLIMDSRKPSPVLVAKVPRLPEIFDSIQSEAQHLIQIQQARAEGFDSIPKIVAFEAYKNYYILVETALTGYLMQPSIVQNNPESCCELVLEWLLDVQKPDYSMIGQSDWYSTIVESPLAFFSEHFPLSNEDKVLLEQAQNAFSFLAELDLPFVIEHGDLSHPNIIVMQSGKIGIVDWELSNPAGMLASDLFFFLSYIVFSLADSNNTGDFLTPFEQAFFKQDARFLSYIHRYAQALHIDNKMLSALFVLSWTRYMINLYKRLYIQQGDAPDANVKAASMLYNNRYYDIWKYVVTHVNEIGF